MSLFTFDHYRTSRRMAALRPPRSTTRPAIAVIIAALSLTGLATPIPLPTSAAPAGAIPYCEGYDCEPDDGGGGTSPVVTVRGTFRYLDGWFLRPISFAKVEIWRFAPRWWGGWGWGNDRTVETDPNGFLSADFDAQTSGIVYALRVFASNHGAVVWPSGGGTVPFYREPPSRTTGFGSQTLDFSTDYTDASTSEHYNLAETVHRGHDYVFFRRGDSDRLGRANVQPGADKSWYNPTNDTVTIAAGSGFNDFLILHEFAHFVEEQISGMPWIPSSHDGCIAKDVWGYTIDNPEFAWMEGFADYFAHAVARSDPGAGLTGSSGGTPSVIRMESPHCSSTDGVAGDRVEIRVAGVLWDTFDQPGDAGALSEAADTLGRRDIAVLQIMDNELDPDRGDGNPTITRFRHAWIARGLPADALNSIFTLNQVPIL